MTLGGGTIPSLELAAIRELAAHPQWVCWRLDVRRGDTTKVPITPRGSTASTTDRRTWSSFEACAAAFVQGDPKLRIAGVGFVLTADDPYVGLDLDDKSSKGGQPCILPDGALAPWAAAIVEAMQTYTERSPSGRGLRLICRGELPLGWRRFGQLERYDRERYLTITGQHWDGAPESIEERSAALAAMHGPVRAPAAYHENIAGRLRLAPTAQPPAEKLAALLSNDRKFKLSWEHRRSDLADSSLSTYDLSLASIAIGAGWSDQEIADLVIAHRRSYGDVGKALRADYIERTIATARAARSEGISDSRADLREIEEDGETTEDAIARVRSQLKIPLRRVVRMGDDRPIYALTLESGLEIVLGSSTDLLQQGSVRAKILDATRGLVIPRVKGERWDAITGLIVAHAEPLSPDEVAEIDTVAIARGWVADYLAEASAPIEISDDALRSGQPLRDEDGSTLVNAPELARWVALQRGEKLTTRELALRLRAAGFPVRRIDYGPRTNRRARRYWKVKEKGEECDSATDGAATLQ